MGDAQSAQREGKKDAGAEEDSSKVEDAQTKEETQGKPFKNNEEISELSGKTDGSIADVNGHCEDEIAAEAIHSQDKDGSRTEKLPTELENVELNETQIPEANEEEPMEIIDMEVKQNDINESFRRFFSNIGLKLTVKRGSTDTGEIATIVPDETNKEEQNIIEDETANETKGEDVEQNTEVNKVQETCDSYSTTCPTLTDGYSEDVLENVGEKITQTKDQALNDIPETVMNLPIVQDAKALVDDAPKEEPESSSPSNLDEEVVSPIKKFFTTGIFSSLRKKKLAEDETADKELVDPGKKESVDEVGQTVQDQQEQIQEIISGVEAHELKDEIQPAESAQTTDSSEVKSASTDQSRIIVNEPEMLTSQEKDKVQASPLKRLLLGSSLTRRSKKQKGRRSSDAKLSDSGEHIEDQLMSSSESTECLMKDKESPAPPLYAEGPVEEEGAWASFKKLMTPKKRMKQPLSSKEETQIPVALDELKPGDQEQITDHSTEESKKRKDSSVSWEAVLCGSGRRRSQKTSDSEEETPQGESDKVKQDIETYSVEPHLERSNEGDDITACSPKKAGSPSESDGGSTWKSFKKLVTPKRKAKDEEEVNIQSDSEVTQEESSFSIKKFLPGRKKRKAAEKPDQVSSDEADKEAASGDEDSEMPAVVPLSEFDTPEAESHIQSQANIESTPKVPDHILRQDQLCEMTEHLQTSVNEVQDSNEVLVNETSTVPALSEEPDDLAELISKHQQLSDIPEEGIITDTMATPASVTEEAARDDTIAEDIIELTSEAITAPEPVDSTQADETEMISAVSQLSESLKTSGNTTPVQAEYDLKETELLLEQVVETISVTPDAITVCSEDLYPERIAGSVSHQIFETTAKEERTILKIHRQSDATASGLKVSTLDEFDENAASARTECISELNEAVFTEIASEVSTEEFDSAQLAEDQVHKVDISQPHESIKEFEQVESKDDNKFQMQSQSEVTESVSTEILRKGEDVVPDEVSLLWAHQREEEPSKIYTQEKALSAAVEETAALVIEQAVESLLEIKDEIIQHDSSAEFIEAKEQLTKADDEPENQDEQQAEATKTKYIQNSEMLDSQLSTTPAEDSVQLPQKEHTEVTVDEADKEPKPDVVKIDEVPAQEEDTFQSLEKEITEDDAAKQSEHEPPADTVKIDHDQVAVVLDLGVGTVQVLEKEVKDDAAAEIDKPQEKTKLFTEVAEELEIVQKSTLDSGERNVLSPEEKRKSKDHSQIKTDKFKQETDPDLQNKDEQDMNASQPEHAQETEILYVAQAATLNSGVISEDTAAPDLDESTEETKASGELEELPLEATKTEHDENKVVTETETQQSTEVVVQPDQALENENHKTEKTTDVLPSMQFEQEDHNSEDVDKIQPIIAVHISSVNDVSTAQILEKTVITEETPAPCVDKTVAIDEPEHEIHLSEVQVGVKEEIEGHLPHTETRTAEMECAAVPEVIAFNLKDVMAAIPDLVIKKSSIESENIEISEVTPVPCVDNIVAQDEPKHKIYLNEVEVSTEKAKKQQFSDTEMGTTEVQHAVVAEVITCNLKEVTSAIPDIVIEQILDVHDPMIGTGRNEQEFRETVETASVLIKDKVTETVQEGNTVVMMHMASVEFEDTHSIQVQIVNVDMKSAETSVDTVKAGVIQTKEIVDVCHETVKKVDYLSAAIKIKEEIISEEDKVTIKQVLQHVKDNLPEPKPVADVGQEVKEQQNDSTQQSDMVERKLNEEEGQKMVEDEEEDTIGPDVTSDDSQVKQKIKHDQTPDLPEIVDASFHDDKEESDKSKAELEKTSGVAADQLAVKTTDVEDKEVQNTQSAKTEITTSNNTALAIPQNTGIISSLGNVESPSSLSLEFKLNIQFGQSKTPASPTSPPSPTQRAEFVKSTEMSEFGIQAVETIQVVTQTTEPQGAKTSLKEAAVQATEVTESAVAPESLETALIKDQPFLMDVGIQSVGTVESEEQITSTEEGMPCVQGAETTQPEQPTEKPEVLLSQLVVSKVPVPQVELVEQIEEECDQDVWMDAEENISTQDETEVPHVEMEESLEYQSDNDLEPKAEFHMAHTEEEESYQEIQTTDGMVEIESEGEDFAVAVEDPENVNTSTSTTERD